MITQEKLKERFIYNQFTGIWFYRDVGFNKQGIGCVATKYSADGYSVLSKVGKCVSSHRLAFLYMTGQMPKLVVDHINHIRDDNRWCNLRDVTRAKNNANLLPRGHGEYSEMYRSKKKYSIEQMKKNIKMIIDDINDSHVMRVHGYLMENR